MIVNGELGGILDEAIMGYLKVLYQNLASRNLEKPHLGQLIYG
jgi:hypothetical protein